MSSQVNGAIKPDALARTIKQTLEDWTDDLTDGITEDVLEVAHETADTLCSTSPRRTRHYANGWAVKQVKASGKIDTVVHNIDRYQLTHLLEKGHATRSGGRTRAVVHIATAEETAIKELTEKIEKRIGK